MLRKGLKRIAVLLGSDGERYKLPVLDKVRVLALNDRGVLLAGIEIYPPKGAKGNGPIYPQTWWCVLVGGPQTITADLARARAIERSREAERIDRSMVKHEGRRR